MIIATPKQRLELANVANVVSYTPAQLKAVTIATGQDFIKPIQDVISRLNITLRNLALKNISRLKLVRLMYPFSYTFDTTSKSILVPHIGSLLTVNVRALVALAIAGSTFTKKLRFNDEATTSLLTSLIILCFGKRFGITQEQYPVLQQLVKEYVDTWPDNYAASVHSFLRLLQHHFSIDKTTFVTTIVRRLGIDGVAIFEDYHRLVAYIVASTTKISPFNYWILKVNRIAAQQLIQVYLTSK